ncbi:MAG: hypothetical protein FWD36_00990 [Treponema sp.]|nr:hypothetical protein [Treponema sp.]
MAKFRINTTLCVFLAAVLCLLVCGCTEGAMNENRSSNTLDHQVNPFADNEPGTFDGLSAKTEWQIKYDYLQNYSDAYVQPPLTIDDFQIDYYFGNYNGYEVIGILGGMGVADYVRVAGKVFIFPRLAQMFAWDGNGSFYDIQDAYASDLLTIADINSMYVLHYRNDFEGLDAATSGQIELDFLYYFIPSQSYDEWNRAHRYLGTYNGYVIITIVPFHMGPAPLYVDGIWFGNTVCMFAWKPGEDTERGSFYKITGVWYAPVAEIDYKDFLTENDLRTMFKRNYTYIIKL